MAFIKRAFDIAVSFIGLIICLPLLLALAAIVAAGSPGGVFFRGVRVGRNGVPFRIFKFRSMRVNSEGNGKWNVGDNDDRVTPIGHFLRHSKLDELPQLINVLKGDMSLVGPRPELQYYVDMYTPDEKCILEMKPGITDWASLAHISQYVSFTASADPDAEYLHGIRPIKLRLQLYYYRTRSLKTDLRILWWTFLKIINRRRPLPSDITAVITEDA